MSPLPKKLRSNNEKARHNKRAIPNNLYGELTNINVELLFRDLFALRDRFKELSIVIKNGEVYLQIWKSVMFNLQKPDSKLYGQNAFDNQFMRDLQKARKSAIIESPFLRTVRVEKFIPILHRLKKRGVTILLNTKPLEEHDEIYRLQVQKSLSLLQSVGVEVLFTVKHHRKLAIIDREIIYEGSLNIFSYRDSCEIMRRTTSALEAEMLIDFIGLNKFMEVK